MKKSRAIQKRKFAHGNYFIIAGILILLAYRGFALYQNEAYGNVQFGGSDADVYCATSFASFAGFKTNKYKN